MKKIVWTCAILALGAVAFGVQAKVRGSAQVSAPRASAQGGEVRDLVLAAPFVLDEPWTHAWRAESPSFRAGWLLVLEVDPKLVRPTELAQPVLCGEGESLERMNHGFESGRVVAILPSELDARGYPSADLASTTFFFAPAALPESTTGATIRRELGLAHARGLHPFDGKVVAEALLRGGGLIAVRDRVELDRLAAQLILEHAPSERERAEQMLVPVTR